MKGLVVQSKIMDLFVCVTIVIGVITITVYNKKSNECITVAIHTEAVIVDHNKKIYEDSFKNKEVSISNM
jgi:hypothetical protein